MLNSSKLGITTKQDFLEFLYKRFRMFPQLNFSVRNCVHILGSLYPCAFRKLWNAFGDNLNLPLIPVMRGGT